MDRFAIRREKLRKALRKVKADALLITNFVNVTYLTGFTGDDSYLLMRPDSELILSDPRYTTQLEGDCPGMDLEIRRPGITMLDSLVKVLRGMRLAKLGFEADSMSVGLRDRIADKLRKLELVPTTGLVEELRQIKDKWEIGEIRRAAVIAEDAFAAFKANLDPAKTEKQIADELESHIRQSGARWSAFPTIVAAGPRAALPHAVPTDKQVGSADFILVDWGAESRLYKSDLTRVVITGKISSKLERVYRVVHNAQAQAIAAMGPGVAAKHVDRVARRAIAKAGFGRYFGHGLGHGVGLEIHEAPRLAAKSKTVLQPGMVITVEPGIYLPGWGGVRIEDDVLITRSGHEVLTTAPRDFEEAILG